MTAFFPFSGALCFFAVIQASVSSSVLLVNSALPIDFELVMLVVVGPFPTQTFSQLAQIPGIRVVLGVVYPDDLMGFEMCFRIKTVFSVALPVLRQES